MAFPFRSQSVGALVEAVAEGYTNARIGTLLLKAGAEDWAPEHWDNKEHRMQLVFKALGKAEDPAADQAALESARLTLETGSPRSFAGTRRIVWWEPLRDALAADGWEYDVESARLTSIVPEVAVSEELNGLEAELEELRWSTSALHFRRAANGFGSGDWESANSQLRSFLEDFLPCVAEALTGKRPANAGLQFKCWSRACWSRASGNS